MAAANHAEMSERYWPANRLPVGQTANEMLLLAILSELRAIRQHLERSSPPKTVHTVAARGSRDEEKRAHHQ
jgi:hypothetical protein